jgi:hypothetical protein
MKPVIKMYDITLLEMVRLRGYGKAPEVRT